jgi:signal transduction histidine kinase
MQKDNYAEMHDFLVSIIGQVPIGIISIGIDGMITMCNRTALDHLYIQGSTKSLLEQPLLSYIKHIPEVYDTIKQCIQHGRKPFDYTDIMIEERILSLTGRKIMNGLLITTNDLTKLKHVERDMLRSMISGQDNERRRLAKDIHDGIGPLMSTIKLSIDSIQSQLDPASTKTKEKIKSISELVLDVASDIRSISHDLMPSALKDFGVKAALENFISKVKRSDRFDIQFFFTGENKRTPADVELAIYRITQELVNNALKYSQAKHIVIQLIIRADQIVITVEDDGVGIDQDKLMTIENSGIGFHNIVARTKALDGTFEIDSIIAKGTTCTISIPF